MNRPSLDEYLLNLARCAATRTSCIRRGVGCVLANAQGHVLGIGYNGVAKGLAHCNEREPDSNGVQGYLMQACPGWSLPPGQDSCEAIHAEVNALLQCRAVQEIDTAYVTLSPCKSCVKLLLNTSCRRIAFLEEHTLPEARELWVTKAGREWQQWGKPV